MTDPAPWMRLWIAQTVADTQHLTAAQLGHHMRLLMLAWRRPSVSVPDDREWIALRLGVDDETFDREVRPVLSDLWQSDGEDFHNEAQRAERVHVERRSHQARQAALTRHHGDKVHPLKIKGKP